MMPSASTGAEHPVLVAAARHGLGAVASVTVLHAPDAGWVLESAQQDHLTGFLADAVVDGAVTIADPTVSGGLMTNWHLELAACLDLERLTIDTGRLLDDAGIRWRLTKGAASAHLDYPDPSTRTFGDVDVVLHPDDWVRALALLGANGYVRDPRHLSEEYDRRYGKGATFTTEGGLELDVHRRFAIGRFGVTSRMEDIFASSDTLVLADQPIPALAPHDRLLHACFHASLGGFRRLRAFRDVAQLIIVTEADWERTFAAAVRWRAEVVVASAILDTWARLGLDPDHPAPRRAALTEVSRGDRRALSVFRDELSFRRQALTAVGRLRIIDRPRYLWSLGSRRLSLPHRSPQERDR